MGTPGRAPAGIGARPVSEPPQLGWPDVHGGPCDRSWVREVLLSRRAYPMQRRAPHRRQNGEVLFVEDVIRLLKAEIEKAGGQSEWTRRTGANRTSVNLALHGRQRLQKNVLDALGLQQITAYVRLNRK